MAERDTFVPVSDGDQLNEGYFNGIIPSGNVSIPIFTPNSVTQGTWAIVISNVSINNGRLSNVSSHALNDEVVYKIRLAKGTYTLKTIHLTTTTQGIYTIFLNGDVWAVIDGYSGGAVQNAIETSAGLTVATGGSFDFKIKVTSKHASSSDHQCAISEMSIYKTA